MRNWAIWVLMLTLGLATYAMRVAFFVGCKRPLPHRLQQALRFVPPAVLAALAVPALLSPGGVFSMPRLIAGGVGILVAVGTVASPTWQNKSVLLTVICGMSAFWVLTWMRL
jgi:branched-subunit amino acid transport protein